jgi:AcrR family transcriptional regulator
MSPRPANPDVRTALLEAAARLLAAEGPAALSSRRLAGEVGTSTMTIYTHFGSMSELHSAVRREGFTRIASALETRVDTDDPVADLAASVLAYLDTALAEPELYRAMFNHRPPPGDDAGSRIFDLLVVRIRRCVDAGRFPGADPSRCPAWAGEVWAAVHGTVTLGLAGIIPDDQLRHLLADTLFRLAVGFGDEPGAARRSADAALELRAVRSPTPTRSPNPARP